MHKLLVVSLYATALLLLGCNEDSRSGNDGDLVMLMDGGSSEGTTPSTNTPGNTTPTMTPNRTDCSYPADAGRIGTGLVIPAYAWTNAHRPDGSTFRFSLEDFHCSPDYDSYDSLVLVAGAGWCPNCPDYMRRINPATFEAQRSLVVYLETADRGRNPASSADAHARVNSIGISGGIRVGDSENGDRIRNQLSSVPSGFFVRRRDMVVVADQRDSDYIVDFMSLATNPESSWMGTVTEPNCSAADEESYEPNNTPDQAADITAGSFEGGICDENLDLYQINITGNWQLDLTFSHAMGDLDLYLVEVTDAGLEPTASSDSTNDNESLSGTGPALIAIQGYAGATATYNLTLTELTD